MVAILGAVLSNWHDIFQKVRVCLIRCWIRWTRLPHVSMSCLFSTTFMVDVRIRDTHEWKGGVAFPLLHHRDSGIDKVDYLTWVSHPKDMIQRQTCTTGCSLSHPAINQMASIGRKTKHKTTQTCLLVLAKRMRATIRGSTFRPKWRSEWRGLLITQKGSHSHFCAAIFFTVYGSHGIDWSLGISFIFL